MGIRPASTLTGFFFSFLPWAFVSRGACMRDGLCVCECFTVNKVGLDEFWMSFGLVLDGFGWFRMVDMAWYGWVWLGKR